MLRFLDYGMSVFHAARDIGPVAWPHHDFLFIHEGEVELQQTAGGENLHLAGGQGVLVWPHTHFHGRVFGSEARASIQHFAVEEGAPDPWAMLVPQRGGWTPQAAPPSVQLTRDVERGLAVARRAEIDPELRWSRQALLVLIFGEGGYWPHAEPPRAAPRVALESLEPWLTENLPHNPGVAELAAEVGLSPSRFRTVFKAEHGITAGEFLRQTREREARRRLTETLEPIKAIAAALGYSDPVAFHHAFKIRTGMTPAVYRREHELTG